MNHASLFSGIGGFDLASEWIGWNNVFQVEIDEFCQKVLTKNFPDVKRYKDIKEFNGAGYRGIVDVISGGFPCQPFSVAGKRGGREDNRYLWDEMLRVISEVKPRWVVGENVTGILSMENGKIFEGILSDLENEGYETESFIIPACGVGAWHRRDRIWLVAQNTRSNGCSNGKYEKQKHIGNEREPMPRGKERVSGKKITENAPNPRLLGQTKYEEQTTRVKQCGKILPNSPTSGSQGIGYKSRKQEIQSKNRTEQLCENVSNTNKKRMEGSKEAGNTKKEGKNPDEQFSGYYTGGEYWAVEPSVGRVASRVSSTLDKTLNDYKYENANDSETIAKIDKFRGEIMRDMWYEKGEIQQTSPRTEEGQDNDFMYSMPHGYSHERWKLGERIKENKILQNLWQRILSQSFEKTQHLQSRMLKQIREIECNEKVAFSRVDRLKGLGNAIVPQIAYEIFKCIDTIENNQTITP